MAGPRLRRRAAIFLGEPLASVHLAQRGDLVLAGTGLGFGVCLGTRAAGIAFCGLVLVPITACALIRSPTLDRPKAEFSGFAQGDGLVTPPDFVSMIGTLLPIAPCGRSSL